MTQPELPASLISERLDWLFKNHPHPDGREYKYQEVEEGTESLGYRVSSVYIWKLRKGEQAKPNWMVLRVLAQFFSVPITFFFDESLSEEKMEQYKIAAAIQEKGVQEIALRAGKLSKAGRRAALEIIKQLANVEDDKDE